MELLTVSSDSELESVISKCRVVVVFFSGRQCSVCVNFERMLRALCRNYRGICCVKAYSDVALSHVKELGVMCVPSLVGYVDGRPVAKTAGILYAPTVNMFLASLQVAYG
ncbi:MAG: thioredoxin family protein [Thermoproteus sp.]